MTEQHVADASLVLTVLNEEGSILAFLESVSRMTVLPAEIVVVDGGSRDGTLSILHSWAAPGRVDLVVEILPGANISEGRNRAIELARYDSIAVSDAGTTLNPAWLAELLGALAGGADIASGFFASEGDTGWAQAIGAVITPSIDEIDPDDFLPSSRSVAFTKALWHSVGGYPEWLDYCEDLVFDLAAKRANARFEFAPDAVASWDARPTLWAFAKQYYRYARGDGKAHLWRRRHIVRYGSYAVGTALIIASSKSKLSFPALVVLSTIYLSKFYRRVYLARHNLQSFTPVALLLVPIIVTTGDVAKMLGYPAGLMWSRAQSTKRTAA